MMKKFALIKDNTIIKFKNISDSDITIIPKLTAHGYLPVNEQIIPSHDNITQTLSDTYEIQKDKVLRVRSLIDTPFEDAKKLKQEIIKQKTLDGIKVIFETTDSKIEIDNILSIKKDKDIQINAALTNTDLRLITDNMESGYEQKETL